MEAPKRKILIVDDELAIRTQLQRFITLYGHEVLQASTGEEGLKMMAQAVPDLLLLDLSLPGSDGLSTLRTLHEKYPNVPVVMLAAPADVSQANVALNCGASDYLSKPVDHAALKRALQIHLH